jgi:putrescine transport system substrate-binding protein
MSGRFFGLAAAVLMLAIGPGRPPAAHAADTEKTLNIYNWSDYIAPDTIPNFEKLTGIKVNYDTFDANETLEGKLAAGSSGYDVVVPTLTPFLARQIKAGFYQKLDRSKLPNWVHLDKAILERMAKYDPDNAYAIPWMTGTTGIGYNEDEVKALLPSAPVDSLHMIFDPAVVAKFKDCGVSILDSPTDVYPSVLRYLGLDPDSQKIADLKQANAVLLAIRPFIRKFDSSEYINDLANGDICLAWGYSSDINLARRRAQEAGKGVHVAFSIPKEGTERYIDTWAMTVDAPHPAAALAFLNYLMDPEVAAANTNYLYIESGNADAMKFVKPEITAYAGAFPSAATEATLFTVAPSSPEVDRARTRLWATFKTGY